MFENGQLAVLNINDILPNRFQPRIKFDEERLEELAESIGKYGVIQPIVVRPVSNKYEIIAGERRYKASKLANRSTIPAIIVNLSDKDSEEIALLENIQRQELSPIEEAVSYKRILDMGYITQEGLAKKIGKSQSTIANKIRLLNLDDEVQSYLLNNRISERHARSLLRIPDKEKQVQMLHRIVEERLTVKQTDREIEKLKEEMNIDNRPATPEVVDISLSNKGPSVNQSAVNLSEEVESLFGDSENVKLSNENKGGNHMDIEKIMREAKDINVPQDTQPKDISSLMQPGNDIQSEPIVREEPAVQTPVNLENNRFIMTPSETTEVKPSVQPAEPGVTFDSMFNQHVNVDVTPSVETPSVNTTQTVTPTAPSVDTAQTVAPSVMSTENINPVSNVPEINQVQNVQPVMEVSSKGPVNEEVSEDTKKVISSAVADALRRFNEKKANNVSSNVQPVPEVVNPTPLQNNINQNVASSIPSTDIIADNTLNEYAINKENQVPLNPASTMASNIVQDVKPVNNQAHFAQIVKLLRDCANQIEQNGYFVNMDEMDLGNQYKVTFTIDKE